jgi:hypothetical protein
MSFIGLERPSSDVGGEDDPLGAEQYLEGFGEGQRLEFFKRKFFVLNDI